jgi:hypothetical protein
MKRINLVALCSVAALAVSLAAMSVAAPAMAKEPTWWLCQKIIGAGKFKDSGCKEETGGEWERSEAMAGASGPFSFEQKSGEAARKKFKVEIGGVFTLEIVCEKDSGSGLSIGGVPGTGKVESESFQDCRVTAPAAGCKLSNPTIKTSVLNTKLAWRESTGEKALLLLKPEGANFATFTLETCTGGIGDGEWKMTGELLELVLPVKELKLADEFWFSEKETEPCKLITTYWTGDLPNREDHNVTVGTPKFTPLQLVAPGTLGKKELTNFCEVHKDILDGGDAGDSWGVFSQGMSE